MSCQIDIEEEVKELYGQLMRNIGEKLSGVTLYAFVDDASKVLVAGGDQRDLLKLLNNSIDSLHAPNRIIAVHEVLKSRGVSNASEIINDDTIDAANAIMGYRLRSLVEISNDYSDESRTTGDLIHYTLTSPDYVMVLDIIKEHRPSTLEALQAIMQNRKILTPPLRNGAL